MDHYCDELERACVKAFSPIAKCSSYRRKDNLYNNKLISCGYCATHILGYDVETNTNIRIAVHAGAWCSNLDAIDDCEAMAILITNKYKYCPYCGEEYKEDK